LAGQTDANGISINANALTLNSGTITDPAGNAGTLTAAAVTDNAGFKVDTTAPTLSTEAITSATGIQNSTLNAGDVVSVTATFSEAVTVTGTPQLQLNIGGTLVQANYTSGSGSSSLVFTYTILAGQTDANGISINANALTLNSGTITDPAGNAGTLTAAAVTDNAGFKVDTTAPTLSTEAITSATGIQNSTLNAGDVVSVTATFSEAVTVTGTPQLQLNIGGTLVQANYTSGSGSSSLVFTYTILAGQTDANGISINANALTLNSGTITDPAGNAGTLTAAAVTDNAGFKVDTTAPTVSFGARSNSSGSRNEFINFSEAVTGFDTSDITIPGVTKGALTTSDNIHWTLAITGAQSGQDYTLTVANTYTDLAGNPGTSGSTNNAPAGISGQPINLALTDPTTDATDLITVMVSGIPLGWSLNAGTNNGDGTWTLQTSDPSALTVTTAGSYSGALVLGVTESWTNADGSTGSLSLRDNVEAYSQGSPIFALSGDDILTGSSEHDLFVFSQPIGHDTIYNYDPAADKIDLIGYAGFASFSDVQAHLANDGAGNAVITLGNGQSITLHGVDAASLTANDFVFDQTPVTENAGGMVISDGAVLPLSGVIHNTGSIALNSIGDETDLRLIEHGITLQGGGHVDLSDSSENVITGTVSDVTLTNVDNTISGAGHLGDGVMVLVNEGTIIATGTNALDIDTGSNAVTNTGTLEATGTGGLEVHSDIINTGALWANGGNVTIDGNVSGNGTALISGSATLEFAGASAENTAFASGSTGTLVLDHAFDFSGIVSGVAEGNHLDLLDFNFANATLNYTANANGTGGTLSVTDGAHTANIALLGQYDPAGFQTEADKNTGTLISYHDHLA
ncbi:Ig-like domain-containing protein, partial [Bradyrhizobium sp. SSUT77]|uniref:beta strand repeat-containing protein n=1 Tax=Bradyrhizobium sp. SSUT77 TaxID=3040603 RepID=UPI002448D455